MAKMELSAVINRPVEEVFSFVTDLDKMTQWSAELVEVKKTSEGPVGLGTTFTTAVKFLGRRTEVDNEVSAYEPNKRYNIKVTSGPITGGGGYTFESVDGGTKATFAFDAEIGGFLKMAEPLAARMMRRQYETNLATMKDLLEAGA